jgi:mannosyltransferase
MVVVLLIGVCTLIYSYSNKTLLPKLKSLFQNSYFKIIVLWFIVPYTTMFLLSFKVPMFIDRYILYTSISFYLIIVIAIVALLEKASHQWMALSIFIGSLLITVQLNPDNNRRLKEVSDVVKNLKNENTITLLAPDYAYMGFAYHYNIDYFKDAPNTIADLNTDAVFPIHDVNQLNEVLKDTYSNCLYIQAGTEFSDPGNLILKEISKKYKFHKQVNIYQIYIIHQFYN